MKEYDEAIELVTDSIFSSKWFFSNNKEHARILANKILNLKGDGWNVAIIRDQGLIGSFVINEENPKFYQEVIWQAGGDKEDE